MMKSGILVPIIAMITQKKSIFVPLLRAARMPSTRPNEIARHRALIPRSAENGNVCPII